MYILRQVQSNLCITTTFGTPKLWPLLTGGPSSDVAYAIKIEIRPLKWLQVVLFQRWLLAEV
jgi:hypothetical protein